MDRAIQIVVRPLQIIVLYEISLSELTLTQDLRSLIGTLPGGDRSAWLARYAEITGPLNAKGLLLAIDQKPATLEFRSYTLDLQEHPRYTFRFEAPAPTDGQISLNDTNFIASEGTSRLAARAESGIELIGDLPEDVQKLPMRPVWELTDEEDFRTKHASFRFRMADQPNTSEPATSAEPAPPPDDHPPVVPAPKPPGSWKLTSLIDHAPDVPWPVVALFATFLGAVHALQPGHGKALVSALALNPSTRFFQPALVAIVATMTHISSVMLIALGLWLTGSSNVESAHRGLSQIVGFLVATIGFWRLGRLLGGNADHTHPTTAVTPSNRLSLLSVGIAAGIIPCWDAVVLLLLSAAVNQLKAGVVLVLFFSAGMATVLVAVGSLAWKMQTSLATVDPAFHWRHRLEILGGLLISTAGLFLFLE